VRTEIIVDQLTFDRGLGTYSVSVVPDSVWISKGIGTHYFQIQLEIGIPQVGKAAGRLLYLETVLYVAEGSGPRAPLGFMNISVPFNPAGEVRRPTLYYLITNAQLLAMDERRSGDLRLELQVNGILPQAASGFPGATQVTEHIAIAESRWRQQLAGLGRTLGAEMLIPFPDDNTSLKAVGDFLRESQRQLASNEIDAAMLQVRKALETVKNTSSWKCPGKKDKGQLTASERWALIRAALEDQASGAMHVDPGTRDHKYTRAEVEALIAMTAALVGVMA
jgi:hypothetical protein